MNDDEIPDVIRLDDPDRPLLVAKALERAGFNRTRRGAAKKRKNKFNAKTCSWDGYTFQSLVERRRYLYWKDELAAGRIVTLEVHPMAYLPYGFTWRLDFWVVYPDGSDRYEDVKGAATRRRDRGAAFKRRLFDGEHPYNPVRIVEERTNPLTGRVEWTEA